jgi:hypothetical protein
MAQSTVTEMQGDSLGRMLGAGRLSGVKTSPQCLLPMFRFCWFHELRPVAEVEMQYRLADAWLLARESEALFRNRPADDHVVSAWLAANLPRAVAQDPRRACS